MREPVLNAEILPKDRGVLSNQIDFAHALPEQARCFEYNRFESAAAVFAPVLRNHAERAWVIAAFGNFDVSEVPGRREDTGCEVVIQVRRDCVTRGFTFAELDDFLQLVSADQRIDLRQVLLDVTAIAFNKAPGDD